MRFRLTHAGFAAFVAVFALAASAAHGFTVENKDSSGDYTVPKFDLEEQTKNFRKGSDPAATAGKNEFDTPIGKLQFGVGQGSGFSMGPGFGPAGPGGDVARNSRQDFNRITAPPTSLDYYGVR